MQRINNKQGLLFHLPGNPLSLHRVEPAKPLISMLKWAGRFIYELFEQNESAYPLGRAPSID